MPRECQIRTLIAHGNSIVTFCVYMMMLGDGRIYTGHTSSPARRSVEHKEGKGCRATGMFGTA